MTNSARVKLIAGRDPTVLVLLAWQITAAIAAFLVNIAAPHAMAPGDRGVMVLALQLTYMASTICVIGQDRPYIKASEGAFSPTLVRFVRILAPGYAILAGGGVIVISIMMIVHSRYLWLATLVTVLVALNMLSQAMSVALIVSRDWRPYVASLFVTYSVLLLGVAILTLSRIASPFLWLSLYFAIGIVPVILLIRGWRHFSGTQPDSEFKRRVLGQGVRLLPASLGNTAMLRSDRLLLPIFASLATLGQYSTVGTLMEVAAWPAKQWVDASLRKWTKMGSSFHKLVPRMLFQAMISTVGLSTVVGLFAYWCFMHIFPSGYRAAIVTIVPLGVASVIYSISRVSEGLLIVLDAPGMVSLAESVGWVVAILAYVMLIPHYGILGAAYGSIIGYSANTLLAFVLMIHTLQVARRATRTTPPRGSVNE